MMQSRLYILIVLLAYYTVWFTSIILAARGYSWLGAIIALGVWLLLIGPLRRQWRDFLRFTLLFVSAGFIVDSLLSYSGFVTFKGNPWNLAPAWIVGIWLMFSLSIYACIRNYLDRYLWLAIASLFGFPLAYLIGVRLGAATLYYGDGSLFWLGFVWFWFFPLLCYFYQNKVKDG